MRAAGARPSGGIVNRNLIRCIALSCVLAPAIAASGTAGPLTFFDDARRLIREHRAADAYQLLAQQELALAGQPDFDYLFGVAALDSGRTDEAIAALQRVLAQDPEDASARLELGRAYFESGNHATARRHFQTLVARDPPAAIGRPSIGAMAEAYLRAMDEPAARSSSLTSGFDFGTGYDSNANASTSDRTFLGVTLNPHNVATSSAFAQLAGWLDHARPVGERSTLATTARIGHRWNPDAGFVDQTIASLDTTLQLGNGPTTFSIGGGGYYGLLDGESHRWGANVDLSLAHRFGDGWRASALLRAGQLRYDNGFPGLSVLDMDQLLGAFSLQRAGSVGDFGMTVYAGTDDPSKSGSAFGNDRLGVQLYAGSRTAAGHSLQFQFGWQEIDFDDSAGFFLGTDRSDDAWSAALVGEIRDWPAAGLDLMPRVSWQNNDSNISLYQYDRFEFGLTLRRSFR